MPVVQEHTTTGRGALEFGEKQLLVTCPPSHATLYNAVVSVAGSEVDLLERAAGGKPFREAVRSLEGQGPIEERLTGNIFSNTVSTSVKLAVLAPMPSASVSTATEVEPEFFSN